MNPDCKLCSRRWRIARRFSQAVVMASLIYMSLFIHAPVARGDDADIRLQGDRLEGLDYTTIVVEEKSGEGNNSHPVNIGVPIPAVQSLENIWLARVGGDETLEPVALQVLEVLESDWQEGKPPPRPVKVIDIVFLADLEAGEEARFRLYYGEEVGDLPGPETEPALGIEIGDGLARSIDAGPAEFEFHDKSGQLLSYKLSGVDRLVGFWSPDEPKPIHHNPDVWVPHQAWGHTSGWNIEREELAPEYDEADGPLAWRSVRTGHIPRSNETEATVTYTAFAGLPVLFESSAMRFTRNTAVNAVRNNELVFRRGLHTHGIYIDHDGELHTFRLYDPDEQEKCFAHIGENLLPPDVPFIGMFHEDHGYGIGIVTLGHSAMNVEGIASPGAGGAHYYFCEIKGREDPDLDFTYFCRGEVFNTDFNPTRPTWQRHKWNTTVIPAGALYAERSAILAFEVDSDWNGEEDAFVEVERWIRLLRRPPRISIIDGIDSRL